MIQVDNLILGAGIAGLGAGLKLKEKGKDYLILEKEKSYGGLCDNFSINGFLFDRFVHLSFSTIERVKSLFSKIEHYTHNPAMENYWHGIWIKHPAQNNLFPLPDNIKQYVLQDMQRRKKSVDVNTIQDYDEWLRFQFGDYFTEHFPLLYTRKYWGVEAKELETKWIGNRIYQPSIEEVLEGMRTSETGNTYYAKEMRYPKEGGYKSFLQGLADEEKILCNQCVVKIDTQNHKVYTESEVYEYNTLYSSIPLPEYKSILPEISEIGESVDKLSWTSGYLVSLGFKGDLPKENLWNYVYDEDILPARIFYPRKKSEANCPDGCSSLQAEIYFKYSNVPKTSKEELLEKTVEQLDKTGIIHKDHLLVRDIRFEKYANVIFEHGIYENRQTVISYLKNHGITSIGRFGEWDYLWSDQSFMSGYEIDVVE